jgi:hypothetical protein
MKPDIIQAITAIAQTVLGLATLALALLILRTSRRERRAESARIMQELWNVVNTLALSNDEVLQIIDVMADPKTLSHDLERRRKRWISFVVLNAFQAAYLGMRDSILDRSYAERTLEQLLPELLMDEEFYALTQGRGYHPSFSSYCASLRESEARRKLAGAEHEPGFTSIQRDSTTWLSQLNMRSSNIFKRW